MVIVFITVITKEEPIDYSPFYGVVQFIHPEIGTILIHLYYFYSVILGRPGAILNMFRNKTLKIKKKKSALTLC